MRLSFFVKLLLLQVSGLTASLQVGTNTRKHLLFDTTSASTASSNRQAGATKSNIFAKHDQNYRNYYHHYCLKNLKRVIPTSSLHQKGAASITLLRGGASITSISDSSPPIHTWIIPALLCALSYAFYNLSIKKASSSIDHLLGGVFLQIVAAIMGTFIFTIKTIYQQPAASTTIVMKRSGVIWSVFAGITVGIAEILSFYVSSKGVQAMQSIPVIVGGSVLFGTLFGQLWLKEQISAKGWIGILFISAGIILAGSN
jgi:transporter family protein